MNAALGRKEKEPSRPRKLSEKQEEQLLELANGKAPDGRKRWTLHLLAGQLVELQIVEDSISHESVRKVLKKTK